MQARLNRRHLVENNTTRRSRYPNMMSPRNETMNDLCKKPTLVCLCSTPLFCAPFHYKFYSWPTGIYTSKLTAVASIFLSSSLLFSPFSNFLRRQSTLRSDKPFSLFFFARQHFQNIMISGLSKAITLYLAPLLALTAIFLSLFAYLAPTILLHDKVALVTVVPSTALVQANASRDLDGPSIFMGVLGMKSWRSCTKISLEHHHHRFV